jgi:hypothetical protein
MSIYRTAVVCCAGAPIYGNKQAIGVDLIVAFSFYLSIYFN